MRVGNRGQEAIDPDWAFVLVPDYIMIPRDSLSKKHTETETENGNKCRHTYGSDGGGGQGLGSS